MKSLKLVFFLTMAASLMSMTVFGAGAAILLDEDFEDGVAFEELNWPLQDNARVPVIPGDIDTYQGFEVRAYDQASTDPMTAPVISGGTGAAGGAYTTTDRFFTGARALVLDVNPATPTIRVANPGKSSNFPFNYPNAWSCLQMALSVNRSSALEPWPTFYPTEIAQIHMQETVNTSGALRNGGPDIYTANTVINYDVKLLVNSSTTVDVVAEITRKLGSDPVEVLKSATIGTLEGGKGDWAMLTFLGSYLMTTPGRGVTTQPWICYDLGNNSSGRDIYIGPQPVIPRQKSEANFLFPDSFYQVPSGVGIHLNSDAPSLWIGAKELQEEWGNILDAGSSDSNRTNVQTWYIEAKGGMVPLYIDDLYWDIEGHDDPTPGANGMTLSAAARLQPFTGIIDPAWDTTEARALAVSGPWILYE